MADVQLETQVASVLKAEFGLTCSGLRQLGRGHNNHVFLAELDLPLQATSAQKKVKPGSIPIPIGTQRLVFRRPHPDTSLDKSVIVENEVAMMEILRPALNLNGVKLVPDVYGWSSNAEDGLWMVEEYKDGIDIHETFATLGEDQKRTVLQHFAELVNSLQRTQLPASYHGYGGAGFDGEGGIVSKPMPTGIGGPFGSMAQYYQATLKAQLQKADQSALLKGWRPDGLRTRLDCFDYNRIIGCEADDGEQVRSVVHGELCLQNVLFDPQTLSIVGLLDFELAHVATPLEEFFYSFQDVDGLLCGPYDESPEDIALREAILAGFPCPVPTSLPNDKAILQFGAERHVQWDVAKLWDDSLEKVGALRPRTLVAADKISQVHWFLEKICPFYVLQSRWLASRTETQLEQTRLDCRAALELYLDRWGL